MRSELFTADTSGAFRAYLRGSGFRIVPALPPVVATASEYAYGRRPGRYPLRVKVDGSGQPLHIGNSDARFFAEPFMLLDVEGAESGDVYCVEAYAPGEGVIPAGARTRGSYRVQAATAAATVAPTLSSDGWAVRPQTTSLTFYAAGVLQVARLWVRSLDGTWTDTLEDLDFVTTPVITRFVDQPADRVYLRAAAATLTIAVDAAVEIG